VRLLVLFDVDCTLFLTPDDLYGEALVEAVRDVYGHELTREAIGITLGRFDAHELAGADAVIDSLTALPTALRDLTP
jgi:hypothetical protein